ncbi:hypothetical protein DSM106972_039060 [Dulcicalothrix desertica PCC 7102]|uniref:Uncharacterized protein n=1 Tax=Dulcicalothrix desertica PCC 7102 TaxID=232991 RepID=A0A433VG75_9CYAN|nr:hypothetical protein [Dulcicalothrix desertica]RUT05085.1 hypothetical protein DSM106972_039060 [Dulcicalothrix desertica PCC 7102]
MIEKCYNPNDLLNAIKQLVLITDAVEDNINEYGVFYTVTGDLQGLSGRSLPDILHLYV